MPIDMDHLWNHLKTKGVNPLEHAQKLRKISIGKPKKIVEGHMRTAAELESRAGYRHAPGTSGASAGKRSGEHSAAAFDTELGKALYAVATPEDAAPEIETPSDDREALLRQTQPSLYRAIHLPRFTVA